MQRPGVRGPKGGRWRWACGPRKGVAFHFPASGRPQTLLGKSGTGTGAHLSRSPAAAWTGSLGRVRKSSGTAPAITRARDDTGPGQGVAVEAKRAA